jgi:hypothetical protein
VLLYPVIKAIHVEIETTKDYDQSFKMATASTTI